MVTINFKLSELGTISLNLEKPTNLDEVLHQCSRETGSDIGGYIAVRAGRVINGDEMVKADDAIDIFPAISGG